MDALEPTREGPEAAREQGDRASVIDVAGSNLGTARYARQIIQEWDRAAQAALREQDRRENDRRHRQTMRVAWAAVGISIISMVIACLHGAGHLAWARQGAAQTSRVGASALVGGRQEQACQRRILGTTPQRALAGVVGRAGGGELQAQAHEVEVATELLDQAGHPVGAAPRAAVAGDLEPGAAYSSRPASTN
jgi:hypothetical protein